MSKRTDTMEILTRKAAVAANRRVYWTGHACKKGHEAVRYTTSGACSECVRGYYVPAVATRGGKAVAGRGETCVDGFAHPDDHAAVRDFLAALAIARGLAGNEFGRLREDEDPRWVAAEVARLEALDDLVPPLQALKPIDLSRC